MLGLTNPTHTEETGLVAKYFVRYLVSNNENNLVTRINYMSYPEIW